MKKKIKFALKVAPLVVAGAFILFGFSRIFKEFFFENEMTSFYKFADRYSPSWNISKEEYENLKRLVTSTFKNNELITGVHVVDPTEVHFQILEYYNGPLAAGGYGLRAKKENGKWTLAHSGFSWNAAIPGKMVATQLLRTHHPKRPASLPCNGCQNLIWHPGFLPEAGGRNRSGSKVLAALR